VNLPLPLAARPTVRDSGTRGNDHIIETLQWQCRFSSRALAVQQQDRLSKFLSGPGAALLQELFERISPAGEVWRIDRLEIDLGHLPADATLADWAARLREPLWNALLRLRAESTGSARLRLATIDRDAPGTAAAPSSAMAHELDNFLYYVGRGHLPWSMRRLATRDLGSWLARLAQRTGPRLWTQLQQLPRPAQTLARLCQITPYSGLQALLAVRNHELASSLELLDQQLLTPLRARGRLSAYQMQQLQQEWRAAGLQALWGHSGGSLSTDRLQRLVQTINATLTARLGSSWRGQWQPTAAPRAVPRNALSLTRTLIGAVAGVSAAIRAPERPAAQAQALAVQTTQAPHVLQAAMMQLLDALAGRRVLTPERQQALLQALRGWQPQRLRHELQQAARRRSTREQWTQVLSSAQLWQLLQAFREDATDANPPPAAPTSDAATAATDAAASWAESLRQFALARQRAGAPLSLSQLQTQLLAYTLRHAALGGALPQDHVAWQALWRRGWQALSDSTSPSRRAATSIVADAETSRFPAVVDRAANTSADAPDADSYTAWAALLALPPRAYTAALLRWAESPVRTAAVPREPTTADSSPPRKESPPRRALLAAYVRAAQHSSRLSTGLPPSALITRWRIELAAQVRQAPQQLSQADLAARRRRWQAEAQQNDAAIATPSTRSARTAETPSRSAPAVATAAAQSPRLPAPPTTAPDVAALVREWLQSEVNFDAARHWSRALRFVPLQLQAEVLRWVRQQSWRLCIAAEWSSVRKLELLQLLSLTRPDGGRDGGWRDRWQDAAKHWSWLPYAIRAWARSHRDAWREASSDHPALDPSSAADHNEAPASLLAWLWRSAIEWAVLNPNVAATPNAMRQHWQHALSALRAAEAASGAARAGSNPAPMAGMPPARVTERLHALLTTPASDFRLPQRLTLAALLDNDAACAAWLQDYTEPARWALLQRQFPSAYATLVTSSADLLTALAALLPQLSDDERRHWHWQFLAQHLFVEGLPAAPALLGRRYAMRLRQYDSDRNGNASVSLQRWLHRLSLALPAASANTPRPTPSLSEALQQPVSASEQWEASLTPPQRGTETTTPANHPPAAPVSGSDDAPVYIENAGLVLLAAYAQRLFGTLGLLNGNVFVDAAAQQRAVHSLAYLVSGDCTGDETAWVLNKLLCGLAIADPVPTCADFDAGTRDLLDSLLCAVIEHWKTLGQTSIAGLRESFLQRTGRLSQRDGEHGRNWHLKVEPRAFDVLLDRLPWRYSTIKLPWMAEALYVEWR